VAYEAEETGMIPEQDDKHQPAKTDRLESLWFAVLEGVMAAVLIATGVTVLFVSFTK